MQGTHKHELIRKGQSSASCLPQLQIKTNTTEQDLEGIKGPCTCMHSIAGSNSYSKITGQLAVACQLSVSRMET
jgi:hypothetical protein